MNPQWKAAAGVFLIFIFGWLAGALSVSIFYHHRMLQVVQHPALALSAMLERRLTWNLDLDEGQKQQIHSFFQADLQQRQELQKQIQPQIREVNHQTVAQISAILHPDQLQKFQDNIARIRRRWGQPGPPAEATATVSAAPATNAAAAGTPAH